ncbi:MAG: NAD(P)H-hydrate dehydratase [Bacteroidetes bacterium]|nr:MAG: NAD(P)H-hydrate dehydratase [Bacteroidota bacterium]
MKILNSAQIKEWDKYTITNEPVTSLKLMERASTACVKWLVENNYTGKQFTIFCGKGNNGGDGLAMARLLASKNNTVTVYILETGVPGTDDFQQNLTKLKKKPVADIHYIQGEEHFPQFSYGEIVIDALFGSGLNRPVEGLAQKLIDYINSSGCEIISIDMPSGLYPDESSKGNTTIHATDTLSFQCYKPAFLVGENAKAVGDVHILNIGLHQQFYDDLFTTYEITDTEIIKAIYKPRNRFTHKGNYGHAALIAGSTGMMGAAVLAAKACLRSGVGKLTCYVPKTGYEIMQESVPEAMCSISGFKDYIEITEGLARFNSVGIGPGIGLYDSHYQLLQSVVAQFKKPMIADADALTLFANNKDLFTQLPPYSIITPHPKEFERLFGKTNNDFETLQLVQQKAKEHKLVIVLKGHHTFIATPGGKGFFNSTGNAGMATGGSGDVLTGILTALLAQGYGEVEAAILGVYLHGLAGDFAAKKYSQEAMIAGDIAESLGEAFKKIGN